MPWQSAWLDGLWALSDPAPRPNCFAPNQQTKAPKMSQYRCQHAVAMTTAVWRCQAACGNSQGLVIGGGTVYPELNFTLPDIAVDQAHLPSIVGQYRQMISGALRRAVELQAPGLVVEFETLPPMTEHPDWAMEIVDVLLDAMHQANVKEGLKSALRITPNDNREFERPLLLRSGMRGIGC
jgi:hypothetical protein